MILIRGGSAVGTGDNSESQNLVASQTVSCLKVEQEEFVSSELGAAEQEAILKARSLRLS